MNRMETTRVNPKPDLMRITALLILFLSIISLHACDEDEAAAAKPYHLVKSVTPRFGFPQIYTYDTEDRLIRRDDPSGGYTTYVYDGSQVTITGFDLANQAGSITVVPLTAQGYFATHSDGYYTYNGEGNLISRHIVGIEPEATYNYEYTNGNLIWSGFAGQTTSHYTYTYYTDQLETRRGESQNLLGKPSLNLLHTVTRHVYSTNTYTITHTHTYTYDACNRIITDTMTDEDGDITDERTYTYFD